MGVFSSTDPKVEGGKSSKRAAWFAPPLLIFLAIFGAYYYFHVSRQTEYFAARNLRMLDIVARQISERLKTPDVLGDPPTPAAPDYIKPDPANRRIAIDAEALAAARLTVQDVVKHAAGRPLQWDAKARVFTLDAAAPATAFEAEVAHLRLPIIPGNRSLEWDPKSTAFKTRTSGSLGDGWEPERVLGQVLGQSFVGIFDDLVVADQTGSIIWQKEHGTCSLHNLGQLLEIGDFSKSAPIPFAALQQHAVHRRVLVEGREYRLFSRPFSIAIAGSAEPKSWVVAGLVTRQRFVAQSVAISYTLLIAVLALLLLVIFTLPFLKIALVGELQRVKVADILLLFVSHICATAIMTIVVVDTLMYLRVRGLADVQLRQLAADVDHQASAEMKSAYIALLKLENVLPPGADAKGPLPEIAVKEGVPKMYPFFESFARIDRSGMQRQKWFLEKQVTDRIRVADRAYFKEALAGNGWVGEVNQGRYVVDSIRSGTTGVVQAVIAKKAKIPTDDNAVVALSIPMMSLINPVIAGGCEFAVIDETGRVVFHSDSQRNNLENFFVETDQNRALRAAVAGRQSEMLNLRYWGDDVRAFTRPIQDTPLTLVTFRSKRLLRTLNVETIIITILFLLLYALGFTVLSAAVLLVLPSYRAPWAWPNVARGYDYRRLVYAFVAFAASFAASIYLYRTQPLIVISFTLPAIAVLLTYLRLTRVRGVISMLAVLLAVVYAVLWYSHVVTGPAETDLVLWPSWVRMFVLLSGTLGFVAATFPPLRITVTRETDPLRHLLSPTYSYGAAAAMLLVVAAVLPTAALYKAAYKIEIESFVKQGQMNVLEKLEKRIDDIGRERAEIDAPATLKERKQSGIGVYHQFFFDTRVYHWPNAADVDRAIKSQQGEYRYPKGEPFYRPLLRKFGVPLAPPPPAEKGRPENWWNVITRGQTELETLRNPVPRFVEAFVPQYSEHSVNMRELLHSWSSDERWMWRRRSDHLDFEARTPRGNHLVVTSEVPRLLPRAPFLDHPAEGLPLRSFLPVHVGGSNDGEWQTDPLGKTVNGGLAVFGIFVCIALLIWSIYFITRKVFLTDLRRPLWLDERVPLGPALGGNLLVFARNRERALTRIARERFIEVRVQTFDGDDREDRWRDELTRVDHEPPGVGLLVPDFDYRPASAEMTAVKLQLLEAAAGQHNRNVVAVTTVSPWVLFDHFAATPDAVRWRAVLKSYSTRIDSEPPADAPAFERRRYDHEDALIPAIKHLWREVKKKTSRVLGRHRIRTVWAAVKSPTALWKTLRTTVIVVQRPLFRAVAKIALSETVNGSASHARALIQRETSSGGPFMQQLGEELVAKVGVLYGEEELYDEIGERASAYYATLWSSCSQEEKIVLLHIAADGFANARDRVVIRRLLARDVVRRAPNFMLMNETFRRFVIAPARRREVAQFDTNIPESAWDRVRLPLLVSLLGAAVFFFVTQRELFDASLAVVTGLAGGIPAVLRLVGFLVEPRGVNVAALAPK